MNVTDIGLLRLAAQRVTGELFQRPEDVAKHLLAMQSQDYAGGLWSVGLRTKSATQQDVEKAIAERKIVRTWPMRGTLHFLHADDVHWMVDLLAPRVTASVRGRRINQLGLTDEVVAEAEALMRAELKGGRSIERNQVVELLQSVKGLSIDNQHTQHLMRNFGERGIICFGPHVGKQPTFVLLDEWIPKPADKPREERLAELAERYFVSHGPATLKDFAGWGMLKMSDARVGLEAAKKNLNEEVVDGKVYYYALGLKPVVQTETILLPGFDEYILGYKERETVLAMEHANKVVPGGNGMFLPTVIQDGQVVGLWKRKINKSGVVFEYNYFPGQKSLTTDVSETRYQSFVMGEKV
ncbi:MAG: hypothetical protein JWO07_256 [Candidatus Saccharibacteria bacterium]|nr:hypothetical protein [Candidatus Saccharibacteria bacterium]